MLTAVVFCNKKRNWNLAGRQNVSFRTRIPGHCEPVTDVTGVAISRIEAPFLVDKFRKTVRKNGLYDDKIPESRWRFPHQSADWFGMTTLFEAPAFLYKFQFAAPQNDTERVRLGTKTDHVRHDLSAATRRQIPNLPMRSVVQHERR